MESTIATVQTDDKRAAALQDHLQGRLRQTRERYGETVSSMLEQGRMMDDQIVTLGSDQIRFDTDTTERQRPTIVLPDSAERYLTRWSTVQACGRLGINQGFARDLYDRGKPWSNGLLAYNLQTVNANYRPDDPRKPDRALIRSVGESVRGIQSDSYKRFDTGLILDAFARVTANKGMLLYKAQLDETQMCLTMLLPRIFECPLPNHGTEFTAFGIQFRTSDFGDGAQTLSFVVERARCTNLQVFENVLRQVHLGKKISADVRLSQRTMDLDSKASASLIRDVVESEFTTDQIQARIDRNATAAANIIDAEPEIKRLTSSNSLNKREAEELTSILTRNDPDQIPPGPLTTYKLSQAVAALAHSAESGRRQRDLGELAGKIIGPITPTN